MLQAREMFEMPAHVKSSKRGTTAQAQALQVGMQQLLQLLTQRSQHQNGDLLQLPLWLLTYCYKHCNGVHPIRLHCRHSKPAPQPQQRLDRSIEGITGHCHYMARKRKRTVYMSQRFSSKGIIVVHQLHS